MGFLSKAAFACKSLDMRKVFVHFHVRYPAHVGHIRCPFPEHGATGRTPSFKYYPLTNTFYCWGCKKGGSNIEFVMHMQQTSRAEAIKFLVKQFNLKIEASAIARHARQRVFGQSKSDKTFELIENVLRFNSGSPSRDNRTLFATSLYGHFLDGRG